MFGRSEDTTLYLPAPRGGFLSRLIKGLKTLLLVSVIIALAGIGSYLYIQTQEGHFAQVSENEREAAAFDGDVNCLALMGYDEGRSSPSLAEEGDMNVVKTRAALGEKYGYPSDVCGVVGQVLGVRQFSFLLQPLAKIWPREKKAWQRSLSLARDVLQGARSDPTLGAVFFIARDGRNKAEFAKAQDDFLRRNPRAVSGRLIQDQRFFWLSDRHGNLVSPNR